MNSITLGHDIYHCALSLKIPKLMLKLKINGKILEINNIGMYGM